MDRLGSAVARGSQDQVAAQVAIACRWRTEANRFVGKGHVLAARVCIRINGDGSDAESTRGRDHSTGNLATICNQDLAEHGQVFGGSPVVGGVLGPVTARTTRPMKRNNFGSSHRASSTSTPTTAAATHG